MSTGNVVAAVEAGVYDDNDVHTEGLALENGDYNFTIMDSVGDGILRDQGMSSSLIPVR